MHVHMSNDVIMGFPGEFPMPWKQPFAWNYHVYTCMHMQMHACTCMCTCVAASPQNTLTESHPHPPTPTPPKGGTPEISQKSIKTERIKIFEFCLKILDLWTLVHSYRLHLVCRWRGGVLSQIAYFTFGSKNVHIFCSCELPVKHFPVFTLESDRPCLELTINMIFDLLTLLQPFQITAETKTKVQN